MIAKADPTPKRTPQEYNWNIFFEFNLVNEPGSDDLAADRVSEAMQNLNWPAAHLKQLRLALVEAIQNITRTHSHLSSPKAPLVIRVLVPDDAEAAEEAGRSANELLPGQFSESETQTTGRSRAPSWGFFLVQKQGENPQIATAESAHIIELVLYWE